MNRVEHAVEIFNGIVVPESNNAIALSLEPVRTFVIFRFIFVGTMLRTVYFNQ